MNDISVLLEQEFNIKEKIKSALVTLKMWFEQKMDQVKEIVIKVKDKINSAFRSATPGIELDPEAVHEINKQKSLITRAFEKLKSICSKIISWCKEALSSLVVITKIDHEAERRAAEEEERQRQESERIAREKAEELEAVRERKERVKQGIIEASAIVVAVTSAAAGVMSIYNGIKKDR